MASQAITPAAYSAGIRFEHAWLDLGDVPASLNGHVASTRVVNSGPPSVEIRELDLSCACVDATATRRALSPGETAEIRLLLRADQPGPKSAILTLYSDDVHAPRIRLELAWRVVAPVELEPLSIELGNVRPGAEVLHTIRVARRAEISNSDSLISDWKLSPPGAAQITADDETDHDPDQFTLRFRAADQPGDGRLLITAELENGWTPQLTLPVQWTVRDVIQVTPSRLSLGFGQPGDEKSFTLVVSGDGDAGLEVGSVQFSDSMKSWAAATHRSGSANVAFVDVTARLPAVAGEQVGELTIECLAPEPRTLRIPVSAYVDGSPSVPNLPADEVSS